MIHKEGFPWVFYPLLFSTTALFFRKKKLTIAGLMLSGLNAWFFRNPNREAILNPEVIVSPADGKVVLCNIEKREDWYPEPLWRIAIFMRLWDVHINRSPITGKILKISYFKGEKKSIFNELSFDRYEKQIYLVEREDGHPFWVVQIAGTVARRIKSFVLPGDDVIAGSPIGIIKFGSRVELFFPVEGAEIYVKEGHRVFAGETILGRIPLKV